MAAKLPPPADFDDLARDYASGKSVKAIAAERGVSRHVIFRWLTQKGHVTRNRSQAMFTMQASMTREQRRVRVAAAQAARRGQRDSWHAKRARALARCRAIGIGEAELLRALREAGIPAQSQVPVDVYNVDFVLWGRVAVEPTAQKSAGKHTIRKFPKLCECGLVPIALNGADRMVHMMEDVIAFLKLFERCPATPGQYWVIGCTSDGPRLRMRHY